MPLIGSYGQEVFMPHAISTKANLAIAMGCVGWQLAVLFLLPILLSQHLGWALLMVPLLWLNVTHWGLIHEAIHGNLHPDPRINTYGGRGLSIMFGPSFHVLRFGHLMHHKLNRDWYSEYVGRGLAARVRYYYTLFAGLYFTEILTSLALTFLPKAAFLRVAKAQLGTQKAEVLEAGERFFYTRGNVRAVRVDMIATLALYGAAFVVYGAFWPVLLVFIALRAMTISFFDNLYHYDTPRDNSKAGKELQLPAMVSWALLHGNYHETHHLNPKVPWVALPEAHARDGRAWDGPLLRHGLMQCAGPLA
jgi:fatty acid desaturase